MKAEQMTRRKSNESDEQTVDQADPVRSACGPAAVGTLYRLRGRSRICEGGKHRPAPATDFGGTGLRLLGVLENSYIVAAIPGGLVLIDQHAAHERVLFERILNGIDGTLSQKLLMPITIELSPADMAYVARNLHEFENIGFEIEPFGRNTVKLNAIPAAIKQENVGGFFQDMLARIGELGAA